MGQSKFYFLDTPFYRANAQVEFGSKKFDFQVPISNFIFYLINRTLFEGAVFPEFVEIELPLTEISH